MNSDALEEYSLKWSGHIQHVRTAFNKLLQTNELCDVTLYIEGKKIQAHKVLLSACSKYFDQLFKDFRDERPIIVLKGVQYNILKHILSFIYKGEVNVEMEQLNQFLETAAFLKIEGLIEHYNKRKRKTTGNDSDNVSVGYEPEHIPSSKSNTFKRVSKRLLQKQPRYEIDTYTSNKQPIAPPRAVHGGNPGVTKPAETGKYSMDSPNRDSEWLSDYEFVSQSSQSPYHENIDDPGLDDTITEYLPPIENTDNQKTGPKKMDLSHIKIETVTHVTDSEDEISFNQDEFANSLDEEIETDGDANEGTLEKELMQTPLAFFDEEGLYECKICGKSYARKDSLKKHFAVHVNNTTCTICNKTLSRRSHLIRHLRTHGINKK